MKHEYWNDPRWVMEQNLRETPDSYSNWEDLGEDYDKFIAEHFAEDLDEDVD